MRPEDLESGSEQRERGVRESEERYRSFVEQSTESIWRFELEEPCPTDLAPDEQVEHFYRHGYLAECNDAMARMYGYARAQEIVGAWLGDLLPSSIPENLQYLKDFVRSGYQLADAESQEVDRYGNTKYFSNNLTGIIENEALLRAWGTQRDITERKRVEEASARLAAIVEYSEDVIIGKTLDGVITSWNKGAQKVYGYSEEEVVGKPINILVPPERHDEIPKILDRMRRGEAVEPYETVRMTKDGRHLDISLTVSPIKDAMGNIVGASTIARDITERKRVEKALREQTETLEKVNRIGRLLSSELDLQRLVQAVTDEATELTGARFGAFFYNVVDDRGESYTLYTISGAPREAFSKFPMPRKTEIFGPTFKGEGVVRATDVREDPRYGNNSPYNGMPEGHLPVVSYLAVPVVSRTGETLGGLFFGHPEAGVFGEREEQIAVGLAAQAAIAIDNARLFESMRESEDRLSLAVESTGLGTWDFNPLTGELKWDDRCKAMFGLSPDAESNYQTFLAGLHPEDRERTDRAVQHALDHASGGGFDLEYRTVGIEDGVERWVAARGQAFFDERGRAVRFTGTVLDITERKRAEEALRQSELLYRTVMKQATENIFLIDTETRGIVEFNPAFREALGYPEEELRRMTLYDIVAADRKSIDANIQRVLEQNNTFVGERKYRRKDGSLMDFEVSASVILRNGRKTLCVVAHDVTERKKNEEAQRFLAEASASLSSSLDYRATLGRVARLAIPYLADWCAIDILEEDGSLDRLALTHQNPEKVALARELEEIYPDPEAQRGVP